MCLFGFVHMKATKFRDSSEYSRCVQTVLAKCCLPCEIFYKPKKNCWARKRIGTSLALQCYAGFVSSCFPSTVKSRKLRDDNRRQRFNCSLFTLYFIVFFLYLLSPYSARLCAPCDTTCWNKFKGHWIFSSEESKIKRVTRHLQRLLQVRSRKPGSFKNPGKKSTNGSTLVKKKTKCFAHLQGISNWKKPHIILEDWNK